MTSAEERLYALLPAIYRIRDAEQGEPLKALISVIAEQVAVLDESLAQLYDDQFIETCAEWVAPYIGDLIGYRPLHGVVPRISSPRAEVAHTIGYRRRKGTAAMLEQLARDVTGWHARVVEYFQTLATTQYMNHIRRDNVSPDLRRGELLERIGTPFDTLAHTVDVRRIAVGRGRHNIPNIGVFLWRLNSRALTGADPFKLDERRYLFSALGNDAPLFTRPEIGEEFAGLATRLNVPDPIGRNTLAAHLRDYYGVQKSLLLEVGGKEVAPGQIVVCNLSGVGNGAWAHQPETKIAIDPVLGRVAFPTKAPVPTDVRVTFHYGFSSEMGGGEYDRDKSVADEFTRPDFQIGVSGRLVPVAGELVATLGEAVQAWNALPSGKVGVISIVDSGSYAADPAGTDAIVIGENSRLLVVAAEWPLTAQPGGAKKRVPGRFNASGGRPLLRGRIAVNGTSGSGGQLFLNGVVVEGHLDVSGGALQTLSLRHCTLVPGRGLSRDGFPTSPREPSLVVTTSSTSIEIDHGITGGVRVAREVTTRITNSIVDATSPCGVAFSAPDDHAAGGTLHVENSTVIGKVHTALMELSTNTIFLSHLAAFDAWSAPVLCDRRQAGCIRFSFVPLRSVTPRRYQCQPQSEDDAARVTPQFTSLRYGQPGYSQLSRRCAPEIFAGADDESEMGAFHELFEPQRITNVQVRLDEYLRFGLEAGIFFEPQLEQRAVFAGAYGEPQVVDLCSSSADQHLAIGGDLI